MKKLTRSLLLTALCALALPLSAQVPQIINYQGKIAVGSTPFTGTGQFKFALVDGTGSTSYWSNDGTSAAGSEPTAAVSLPVVNGLYVVPLGDASVGGMTPIAPSVFANSDVRLRVWFNDGSTGSQMLAPDQRITSVGYAMVAQTASIANFAGTAFDVSDGVITTAKLAPQARAKYDRQMVTLTAPQQATFTVTDVAGASLTTKDLGENGTYRVEYTAMCIVQGGGGSQGITTILNVAGTDVEATRTYATASASQAYIPISRSAVLSGLTSGTVIKLKVSSAFGTGAYLWNPTIVIDGVPSSQVVP